MEFKNKQFSRRDLLKRATVTSGLIMPPWLLAACASSEPSVPAVPLSKEGAVPNLNLNISETAWDKVTSVRPSWQTLPDASNERNLLCPSWATNICMGKIGPSFRVSINRTLFELIMDESGLRNPLMPTKIAFMEEWPLLDPSNKEKGVVGGLTAITDGVASVLIVMWMKFAAWRALKFAEYNKQPVKEYFNGIASSQTSEWFVHELAHAGKEIKSFWDPQRRQYKIDTEIVHPQIFDFQKRYRTLYERAFTQGRGANALLVGLESVGNLDQIKTRLYTEAEARGIKFE